MNRCGMISLVDAMVFVSVISIVAVAIFSLSGHPETEDGPLAGDVVDTFLSVELKACDVMDTDDTAIYPISILISSMINSDDPHTYKLLKELFDGMIPEPYGYELTMTYGDHTTYVERKMDGDAASKSLTSVPIIKDRMLSISLIIG